MSDTDFDFGFTSEDELKQEEVQKAQENKEKLNGLREMIMPLLLNLKKNPDMDIIKWEGKARIAQIDSFIKKMDAYIKS
jgi:hypothetical protein